MTLSALGSGLDRRERRKTTLGRAVASSRPRPLTVFAEVHHVVWQPWLARPPLAFGLGHSRRPESLNGFVFLVAGFQQQEHAGHPHRQGDEEIAAHRRLLRPSPSAPR